MKKRTVLILSLLLLSACLTAQERSYFTCTDTGQVRDYRTGLNLELIDTYDNFVSLDKVNKAVINIIRQDGTYYFEQYYNEGILRKEISHVNERSVDELEYDDKNRLIKYGNDFTYKYLSDNEREEYYLGEKKYHEQIESSNNYLKITRNSLTKHIEDNTFVKSGKKYISEYYFNENGKLIEYVEERWYRKGVRSEFVKKVVFEYNAEQKLVKIISGYEGGDIRFITNIEYDEKGNMSEMVRKNVIANTKERVKFYGYDFFGNWHKSLTYDNAGELKETVVREIVYN